jgi:hypothetical protein
MNDNAAHCEEHTGEHLQNTVLNGINRSFSPRSAQTRFSHIPICELKNRPYASPFSDLTFGPIYNKSPTPGERGPL